MGSAIDKFENPVRLQELAPKKTLESAGLTSGQIFFDYGAGTGIFTEAAAEIAAKTIYAYDIDPHMITIIRTKKKRKQLSEVVILESAGSIKKVPEQSIDHLLMATVFHHIQDMDTLFDQFKYLMNESGTITLIEFHCHNTPMGPPVSHRIDRDSVEKQFTSRNYLVKSHAELGENFYCISFQKSRPGPAYV